MRIDRHLILVALKMLDVIGRSRVEIEARHQELSREMVGYDFCQKWRVGNPQAPYLHLAGGCRFAPSMRF